MDLNAGQDVEAVEVVEAAPVATTQQPDAGQLATARAAHWHQSGNAVLSLEEARNWLNRSGLVLYGQRAQLGAPAPSFLEATLGKAGAAELAETDAAKSLLARLVAEGSAVPLNLMGVAGGVGTDVPDFVVSAGVFSYIFTLRGNKAWKQLPSTSGAVKVSPLALAVYEMLAAKVTLSAYDLTTQMGGGVTEMAVLRALTELWGQLRVIPVGQQDGSNTLWELSTARFTKQIKSGANAGQPTALSALISLYLGQAVAATEDEIESFLSPVAPRSRVRDVIHALLSARQLETLVVDGKTLLHVTGELPGFAVVAKPVVETSEGAEEGGRISKFAARPGSKLGTGLRTGGAKPSFGNKPAYGAGDRERRPFRRDEGGARPGGARPSTPRPAAPRFDKPWQENRPARPAGEGFGASDRPSRPSFGSRFPAKPRFEGRVEGAGERPAFGERKTFSKPGTFGRKREGGDRADRPSFGGDRPRPSFGDRPAGGGFKRPGSYTPAPRSGGFKAEGAGEGGGDAPAKRVYRKFDAPRDKKPFGGKPSFGAKPFGAKPFGDRPARPSFGGDRPAKPFGDRPARPSFGGDRPARPSFGGDRSDRPARPFGDRPARPSFGGDRPARPYGDRPAKPFGDRAKPFGARPYSDRGDRPERPARSFDRPAGGDRGEGERPSFGGKPSFGAKPSFGKKPFSKPGGFAGAGGPFAKFADGKKPFRKPGPGKPAGPKRDGGGYGPVKRKRED